MAGETKDGVAGNSDRVEIIQFTDPNGAVACSSQDRLVLAWR